jgi:gas vesicle protein
MSENSSSSGFAFIAGLVVGGAIGAIAGLLFAPETGEETRKKVAEKSKEWADDFYNKFDDLKDSVNEVMEDVKKGTAEVMADVKKGTAEVLDDVKKNVGKKA